MSRHILIPHNPNHDVAVGWDMPLGTLFMQVTDNEIKDDVDHIICWIGKDLQEIIDVDRIIEEAKLYADFDECEMRTLLLADQRAAPFDMGDFIKRPGAAFVLATSGR